MDFLVTNTSRSFLVFARTLEDAKNLVEDYKAKDFLEGVSDEYEILKFYAI